MAEPILFNIPEPVPGTVCRFHGIKPNLQNTPFHEGPYQRAILFEEFTECLIDDKRNPTGILQHPVKLWKEVDIDTPFFKECCHRRLLIPRIIFYFFHTLQGDTAPVNFFTLELEKALIHESKLLQFDTSEVHKPEEHIFSNSKTKPYIEQISFNAQLIRWKYRRDKEPLTGDHGTEFRVP
jgi:type VI protein secretion system component Hcp